MNGSGYILKEWFGVASFQFTPGKDCLLQSQKCLILSPFSGYFATHEYGFGTVVKEN